MEIGIGGSLIGSALELDIDDSNVVGTYRFERRNVLHGRQFFLNLVHYLLFDRFRVRTGIHGHDVEIGEVYFREGFFRKARETRVSDRRKEDHYDEKKRAVSAKRFFERKLLHVREDWLVADGLPLFEAGADFYVVRVKLSKHHRFLHGRAVSGFYLHFRSRNGVRNVIDGNEDSVFRIGCGGNYGNVCRFSFGEDFRHCGFSAFEPNRTGRLVNEVLGCGVLVRELGNDFRTVGFTVDHRRHVRRNRNVHGGVYLEFQARFVGKDLAKHCA